MELRALMELLGEEVSQLEEEDTPYIVEEQIQPLSTNPASVARYYRVRAVVLPQGYAVLPQGHAVLPLAAKRYYRKVTRYNRAGPRYYRCTSNS